MNLKNITQHPDFIKYQGAIYFLSFLLFIKIIALPLLSAQEQWLEHISINALQIKSPESIQLSQNNLILLTNQLKAEIKKAEQTMLKPGKSELVQIALLKSLQELTQAMNLKIVSHQWDKVTVNDLLDKNTLTIHVSGEGVVIQSFLHSIANSDNLWNLESLKLTEINSRGSLSGNYNLSLLISTMQLRKAL
ncbi:hypothetical protein A9Q74_10490 [Colwellia sp. 39_35_sub15_T18]|nr:hypothetical protein A9Q74_10490 [Colwellia sp. 39_35_sub15_T18]